MITCFDQNFGFLNLKMHIFRIDSKAHFEVKQIFLFHFLLFSSAILLFAITHFPSLFKTFSLNLRVEVFLKAFLFQIYEQNL